MLARQPLTTIPRPGNPNVVLHRTPLGEVNMWPNNRVLDLFAIQLPIIQAPMAGSVLSQMVVAVSDAGGEVGSSANSGDEARWLEERGCDAIGAQGYEAGGHRGIFHTEDVSTQAGTMPLVPQVVDAVKVPVIAAGGIADARGIVAAFALGAAAVQIGTAYLLCPEAKVSPVHREALKNTTDSQTTLTNIFTGRPARAIINRAIKELGPISENVPVFPLAARALAPLRSKAEAAGSGDFTPLWSGQAACLSRELPSAKLTN